MFSEFVGEVIRGINEYRVSGKITEPVYFLKTEQLLSKIKEGVKNYYSFDKTKPAYLNSEEVLDSIRIFPFFCFKY